MKKLSILDKSVKLTNKRYETFEAWSQYETQVFNEMVAEKAPIHRMLICKPVWNLKSHTETHTGCAGDANNVTVVCLVLHDGRVLKVDPPSREHKSNYAYDEGYEEEGVTVAEFMSVHEIKPEQVKFIVEVVQCYSEWNEIERKRSITIYGRQFKPSTVLDSFKEIHGLNPWILDVNAQAETVYGHINMDSEDLERIKVKQHNSRMRLEDDRVKVRNVMKFVFGPEMATRLVNFIHFGEF